MLYDVQVDMQSELPREFMLLQLMLLQLRYQPNTPTNIANSTYHIPFLIHPLHTDPPILQS